MPLSDLRIRQTKPDSKPKKISDGGGLFLIVQPTGSKLWRLDDRFSGKQKTLALGAYPQVSLALARQKRTKRNSISHGTWIPLWLPGSKRRK